MKKIGRLHIITDIVVQHRFSHEELAAMAVAGGADTIQFRQKSGSTKEMIQTACRIREICRKAGVIFLVNDRLDWTLACRPDGIHLGQEDFPIPLARQILGNEAIIGGSAGDLDEAHKCLNEGADYIGFGPIFPTSSKEDAGPAAGLEPLRRVVREISLPIIAIGGVTEENLPQILETGVHGIAVISAVCCQEDPQKAAARLHRLIEAKFHV